MLNIAAFQAADRVMISGHRKLFNIITNIFDIYEALMYPVIVINYPRNT